MSSNIKNNILTKVDPENCPEHYVIPDNITEIGKYAFEFCSSLKSISIPNSVKEIGDGAFRHCTSLTSIIIPNSVKEIGANAFSNCKILKSITIPDSVKKIGAYTFWKCTSLTSITIPDSVKKIVNGAFDTCTSLKSINIPDSVKEIGYFAFNMCTSLTSITIPDSVTWIGDNIFWGCTSLTSIICESDNEVYEELKREYGDIVKLKDSIHSKYNDYKFKGIQKTPTNETLDYLKGKNIEKQNGKWVNKGKEGTHGTFKTEKAADAQRKAMFANGFKESKEASQGNKGDIVRILGGYYLIDDDYIGQSKTVHLVSLNNVRKTMPLERFYKEARIIEPAEATNIARLHTDTKIANGFKESKEDQQKFVNYFGQDLVDRFNKLKSRIKAPDNDLYELNELPPIKGRQVLPDTEYICYSDNDSNNENQYFDNKEEAIKYAKENLEICCVVKVDYINGIEEKVWEREHE